MRRLAARTGIRTANHKMQILTAVLLFLDNMIWWTLGYPGVEKQLILRQFLADETTTTTTTTTTTMMPATTIPGNHWLLPESTSSTRWFLPSGPLRKSSMRFQLISSVRMPVFSSLLWQQASNVGNRILLSSGCEKKTKGKLQSCWRTDGCCPLWTITCRRDEGGFLISL